MLSIFIVSFLHAGEWVKIQKNKPINPEIQLISSTADADIIKFNVNAYGLKRVQTPQGMAFVINAPDASPMLEKGAPNLPKLTSSLIIPNTGSTEYEILYSDYFEIENIEIAPSKGVIYRNQDPSQVAYEYGEIYNRDAFWPANKADLNTPFIMRDVRGQAVSVFPFAYNPVQKTLRIYTDITVKVSYNQQLGVNELNASVKGCSEDFQAIYKQHFLNYSQEKYTSLEEGAPGRLLVISYGDFMDEMADYVSWKREKGIETVMVDVADIGNADDIKAYIANEFNNNGLNYVLLVGDAAQVPTTQTGNDSDNEYAYILGDDYYVECFIGRLSAETGDQVTNQIVKILDYERDYDETNTWLENALGSASSEGTNGEGDDGESDVDHMNNIRTDLENYGYTVTHSNQDGGDNLIITNAVNAGIGVANYVGHGSTTTWVNTNYSNTDVNNLTNNGKYPFIWSVACVNGDFRNNTCFAEAWLRATNGSEPSGAVAFLASTINQAWAPPMDGQDEMNDILLESYVDNVKRTMGGISFNGMFHMIEEYGENQGYETADTWTIFGDPSMMVRTKTPAVMTITHQNVLNVGQESFTVNCDVDDALVSLSTVEEGETVILGAAYVSGGSAAVDMIPFTEPGTMKVTVTAFDKVTYQEDVMVIVPDGPYITLKSVQLDDAVGNNDGFLNNAETVLLDVALENVGVETAVAVNVDISTAFAELTLNDYAEAFGDMLAGEIITGNAAYEISLADGVVDQTMIAIDFTITDDNFNEWAAVHNLTVNAPELGVSFVSVDDSEGNGNGIMDPGETVVLSFEVENNGHNVASTGNLNLFITENGICADTDAAVTALAIDGNEIINFTVEVDAFSEEGSSMPVSLSYTAGEYTADMTANLPIGLQYETWESNDFTAYVWENDPSYPWVIVTDEVYAGDHAAKSGDITHSQSSVLTINLNVTSAGDLSFFKKVSCEEGADWYGTYYWYDYLAFSVDGTMEGQWDGEVNWSQETVSVDVGQHSFVWEYSKDNVEDGGQDAAWVDDILLPSHDNLVMVEQINALVDEFNFSVMPNPTAGMTHVEFSLTERSDVKMEIIDMTGRVIKTVYQQESPEGNYRVAFDVANLLNGLFIVKLSTGETTYTEQLVILK